MGDDNTVKHYKIKSFLKTVFFFFRRTKKIRYNSIRAARRSIIRFIIYMIFLTMGSYVTQTNNNNPMYFYNDAMDKLVVKCRTVIEPGLINRFMEIDSLQRYWDFILFTFVPFIKHGHLKKDEDQKLYNFADITPPKAWIEACLTNRTVFHGNVLLGAPRLRQIRVKKTPCPKNPLVSEIFRNCYPPYTRANEDRSGHRGKVWTSIWEDKATPISGKIERYMGAGYIMSLRYDETENIDLIRGLIESNWVTLATRIVVLEFNFYHVDTHLLESVQLRVECPPTGGLVPSAYLRSIRRESFFTDPSWSMAIITIGYYLLLFIYTTRDVEIVARIGFCKYIHETVNLMDFLCYVNSYILFILNVVHHFYIEFLMKDIYHCNKFINLDWACVLSTVYSIIAGCVIFFLWLRVISFLVFNRTMVIFVKVLHQSSSEIIGFLLMFCIVFMAYSHCGMALFGNDDEQFNSLLTSMLTMVRWVVGDFDYLSSKNVHRWITAVYYISFVIIVYAMLVFSFLAIINSTYDEVNSTLKTRRQKLVLTLTLWWHDIYDFFYWLIRRKRKHRHQHDQDHLNELNSEQRIDPKMAALKAAQRREQLQNPITQSADEYLPGRMQRATERITVLEEITFPLLTRLHDYYDLLKADERENK